MPADILLIVARSPNVGVVRETSLDMRAGLKLHGPCNWLHGLKHSIRGALGLKLVVPTWYISIGGVGEVQPSAMPDIGDVMEKKSLKNRIDWRVASRVQRPGLLRIGIIRPGRTSWTSRLMNFLRGWRDRREAASGRVLKWYKIFRGEARPENSNE